MNYNEELERSLPSKNHKMYKIWKDFALHSIQRGVELKKLLNENNIFTDNITILDIGCGEGGILISFARNTNNKVYGIDIDKDRINRVNLRVKENKCHANISIQDGLNTNFKSNYFDLIICNDVVEHVLNPQTLIKEIYRILKPAGILSITAPNKYSPFQILSDSHYGLFGISVLPRKISEFIVVKVMKISKIYDVGFLPSLFSLIHDLKDARFINIKDVSGNWYIKKINSRLIKKALKLIISSQIKISWLMPTLSLICVKKDK